jgi:hypothetical protein
VSFVADPIGEGHIVFAVDEDGDLETQADRELYRLSSSSSVWQPAVRLTSDGVEDSLPTLVAPNGAPTCVWSADRTLVYSSLGFWNPRPLYAQAALADEAQSLAGTTLPTGAAVAYAAGTADGADIFAAFYDANVDQWSLPRRLTHDEHAENSLSLAFDGAQLLISYLKNATLRTNVNLEGGEEVQHLENVPQPGRTDLCLLRHTLGYDLAVLAGSLVLDAPNPAPGSQTTLRAVIENQGDLPVQNAYVAFYDGNPQTGGVPIGFPVPLPVVFMAGATQEVTISWSVPSAQATHDVYVVADPFLAVNDRDRSDNTASTRAVFPDLTIETCWSTEISHSSIVLVARVVNRGALESAPCSLSWRLDSPNGEEIGQTALEAIPVGLSDEVSVLWNTEGRHFAGDFLTVYAVADHTGAVEEFDETNNDCAQSVPVIPPWVPHLVSIEVLPNGNRKLVFTASHFLASEMAVESAVSLNSPIDWDDEPTAIITESAPGQFEAEVPPRNGSAFYRIRVSP